MFEKFCDYMYYLLHSPLKKGLKRDNQLYILFKVLGKIFDNTKEDIFRVREQSMVISADGKFLELHGADRDMVKLVGENDDYYRRRLMMKKVVSEKAGSLDGILLTLQSIGYEGSYIEPKYISNPEEWAEFIIWLKSKKVSLISDIEVIDREVMKVKPASGMPSYGVEDSSKVEMESETRSGFTSYPICGVAVCGGE